MGTTQRHTLPTGKDWARGWPAEAATLIQEAKPRKKLDHALRSVGPTHAVAALLVDLGNAADATSADAAMQALAGRFADFGFECRPGALKFAPSLKNS